jgi:(p)ppGpp synthase/HD superfamily hydrolase
MKIDSQVEILTQLFPESPGDKFHIAWEMAQTAHYGFLRSDSQPFLEHVLKTAVQIAEWTQDSNLAIAALLHDILDEEHSKEPISIRQIEAKFGTEIAQIVEFTYLLGKRQEKNLYWGIEEAEVGVFPAPVRLQALLIKLASGLELAQRLNLLPDQNKRINRAQILLSKYAPLAAQFGMWGYKRNLDDICLSNIAPQEFAFLAAYQKELCAKYQPALENIVDDLHLSCQALGEIQIIPRPRHIYSLYKIVGKKWGPDFETIARGSLKIDNIMRFNVMVPTVQACYQAIQLIHEYGMPVQHAWRDFMAQSKPNGYAALHTAIQIGKQAGIQYSFSIFTPTTLAISQQGLLFNPGLQLWRLEQTSQTGLSKADGGFRCIESLINGLRVKDNLDTAERIRVLTPHGKRITLPKGATPLDFAYHLHTELGNKFAYATVNHEPVTPDYQLQDGDLVEVSTDANNSPQEEWLEIAITPPARSKIKQWLNKTPRAIGENRLRQGLQARGLDVHSPQIRAHILDFVQSKSMSLDALFKEIGQGRISADSIYEEIWGNDSQTSSSKVTLTPESAGKWGNKPFWIKLSGCCRPVFPDEIIGCVHQQKITVHRTNCATALRAKNHIQVRWEQGAPQPTLVQIKIQANDRPGLVRDVTGVIANHFYNMDEFRATRSNNHAWIEFGLELPTPAVPENLLKDLRIVLGVNEIRLPEETLAYLSRNPQTSGTAKSLFGKTANMANPYSPGRPIFDRAMFFGRQQELRSIIQYLTPASQPTSILLCAQRRVGKTSLGLYIKSQPEITREYLPVFLDISTSNRDNDVSLLRKISQHLQLRLREHQVAIDAVSMNMTPDDAYFHFEQILETLEKELKKRLLLILDEFEAALESYLHYSLSDQFFTRLRTWSQLHPVTFLVIGGPKMVSQTAQLFPGFSNIFLTKPLRGLREIDARRLIVEPSQNFLNYDDNAIERILFLTQCYPYYIHLLCASLFNQAGKTSQTAVRLEQVESVRISMCADSARGNYSHLWNPGSACQELVLSAIAAQSGETGWIMREDLANLCPDDPEIESALNELTSLETLEKRAQGISFEYHIRLPLFTGWILNNWPFDSIRNRKSLL